MTTIRTVAEAKTLAMLLRQRKEEQKMKAAGKDPHNGFEPTIGAVRSVRWVEVPYFTNGIPCGGFEDCGEYDYERTYITEEEYDAGGRAVIKARGWSMIGAGIHHDDDLVVCVQPVADDGDIVVARSGNEQTIKVFYHDDNGTPWLVPQNPEPRYVPIPVDEETRIFGRVLAVHHNNPRCKTSLLMQKMMEMEARAAGKVSTEASSPDALQAKTSAFRAAIDTVLPLVRSQRMWFAVCKVMMECGMVREGDFSAAAAMIEAAYPEGLAVKIVPRDLSRLNVLSFARSSDQWTAANAPVQGKVFERYTQLASTFSKSIHNSL